MQAIPETARAQVIIALAKLLDFSGWRSVTIDVDKNKSLEDVVNNQFRFYRKDYPQTTEKLIGMIRNANGITDDRILVPGTPIRVPSLPKRPLALGATSSQLQQHDLSSDQTRLVSAAGKARNEDAREGNGWTFDITQEQRDRFISELGPATAQSVLGRFVDFLPIKQFVNVTAPPAKVTVDKEPASNVAPTLQVRPIANLGTASISGHDIALHMSSPPQAPQQQSHTVQYQHALAFASPAPAPAPPPIAQIPVWQAGNVGKYYVLDFFKRKLSGDNCSHGQLVLDQIRATLERYGAGSLFSKVEGLDIDFYAHPNESAQQMRKILKDRQPSEVLMKRTEAEIESILKTPAVDQQAVPTLYLQNILSSLVRAPDTALISSSFWVRIDGYEMFPYDYLPNSRIPLLSAVLDTSSAIEDETSLEPIRSYRDKRRDYGVALIGGLKDPSTYFGMFSRDGDGVTAIEDVIVKGTTGDCKNRSSEGTSFSTPIVGTYLLLAYSRWGDGATISAKEARRRLLLSSDVNAAYVSKVASAGRPNLTKMLRDPGAWAERLNGDLEPIGDAINVSYIDYQTPDSDVNLRKPFSRSKSGFSGLKVVDNVIYIFSDDWNVWTRTNVTQFVFKPKGANAAALDLNEFVKQYREIVIQ